MQGVLEGFGVIGVVVLAGYVLARARVLGPGSQEVLSQLVFFAGAPALLVVTLARSDLGAVFSPALAVTAISVIGVALGFVVLARLWLRRDLGTTVVGALSSGYVNSVNLGIPVAVFVIGDAAYVAPVVLFQVVVLAPLALAVLDADRPGPRPVALLLLAPLRNPITVATLLGVAIAAFGVEMPVVVERPLDLVAGMAVPTALIAFGASLRGAPRPGAGRSWRELTLVAALKVIVQPLIAALVGSALLGLEGTALLAVTMTAALPTAQNVYVYAVRYGRGVTLARDSISVTTPLSAVTILVVAALLT